MMSSIFADDSFACRIRVSREARGWSQAQLATASGVKRQTLSLWENGTTKNPSLNEVAAVAQVLGVSLDYLAGLDRNSVPPPPVAAAYFAVDLAVQQLEEARERLLPLLGDNFAPIKANKTPGPELAHHPTPEKHAAKRDSAEVVAKDQERKRKRDEREARKPKPEVPEDPFKFR